MKRMILIGLGAFLGCGTDIQEQTADASAFGAPDQILNAVLIHDDLAPRIRECQLTSTFAQQMPLYTSPLSARNNGEPLESSGTCHFGSGKNIALGSDVVTAVYKQISLVADSDVELSGILMGGYYAREIQPTKRGPEEEDAVLPLSKGEAIELLAHEEDADGKTIGFYVRRIGELGDERAEGVFYFPTDAEDAFTAFTGKNYSVKETTIRFAVPDANSPDGKKIVSFTGEAVDAGAVAELAWVDCNSEGAEPDAHAVGWLDVTRTIREFGEIGVDCNGNLEGGPTE